MADLRTGAKHYNLWEVWDSELGRWVLTNNAERDRFIYGRYLAGDRLKTILAAVAANPTWIRLSSTAAVRKAVVRYCIYYSLPIPRRK
jgi:hypothetical protein